ncbi:peptidylprolyl isomerase [uncultured Helicobacter sp.]|uniref:FKBP-type peptidyl-prolyl cis-trans isomerase n=1 Tax=uncultured Helicobacter sp. TaxID=175537 RepID=UPI00374F82CA
MIAHNKVVSIEYEVSDAASKEVIDSNKSGAPLEFLVGANQIISGLENALMGAKTGDKLSVEVKPEDAYGVYQPDLIQEIARDQFEGIDLKAGMTLFGQSDDGQTAQVIVKDFNDQIVIIDYNHPLAGKTLNFNISVLDVRDATEMEILQGGVGGGCGCGSGGGHHHEGGGCCGGGGGSCGCGH